MLEGRYRFENIYALFQMTYIIFKTSVDTLKKPSVNSEGRLIPKK